MDTSTAILFGWKVRSVGGDVFRTVVLPYLHLRFLLEEILLAWGALHLYRQNLFEFARSIKHYWPIPRKSCQDKSVNRDRVEGGAGRVKAFTTFFLTSFAAEESIVKSSQLNKGKLASVRIQGPDKLCVKQQIDIHRAFLHRKVIHLSGTLPNCLKRKWQLANKLHYSCYCVATCFQAFSEPVKENGSPRRIPNEQVRCWKIPIFLLI